jgi:hypothetical protein
VMGEPRAAMKAGSRRVGARDVGRSIEENATGREAWHGLAPEAAADRGIV